MNNEKTCLVSYIAVYDSPFDDITTEIKTDIRTMKMKKPFNCLDARNQASDEMGVDSLDNFILLGITEFEDDNSYNKFFSQPIK